MAVSSAAHQFIHRMSTRVHLVAGLLLQAAVLCRLTDSIEASEEPAAAPAPKADTKPSESTSSTQPASSSTGAAAATATPEEPAPKPMSPAEVAEAIGKRTDLVKQMR